MSDGAAPADYPVGTVIVMHRADQDPYPLQPGGLWFRIQRGWINGFGSEVPARPGWPHQGEPRTQTTVLIHPEDP